MFVNILLGTLGLAIFAGIIFLAISKKSSFKVRIAALGALALMTLSVIIGILISVFNGESGKKVQVLPDAPPPQVPPETGTNSAMPFLVIVFFVALFLLIIFLSIREQRKVAGKNGK